MTDISADALEAMMQMARREGYAQALEDSGPSLVELAKHFPIAAENCRERYARTAAEKYPIPALDRLPLEAVA